MEERQRKQGRAGLQFLAAPMEGVTGFPWRNAHAALFPGADRYYTPFLTATGSHTFRRREIRDVLPESNDLPAGSLVPQILAGKAEDLAFAVRAMAEMGYREVNLNFGCPSATVVKKGKGAGMLRDPDALSDFLEETFDALGDLTGEGVRISVKTRIGIADPAEGIRLMEVYNRFPISLLIIHPRTLREQYGGTAHREIFREMLSAAAMPVCYNGDIRSQEDYEALLCEFPAVQYPRLTAVMAGRGLIADPALFRECAGGLRLSMDELMHFHERLLQNYRAAIPEDNNVLFKMKEFWSFAGANIPDSARALRKMRKASRMDEYLAAVRALEACAAEAGGPE
jgi:tRNA-dihydrouridine synthase